MTEQQINDDEKDVEVEALLDDANNLLQSVGKRTTKRLCLSFFLQAAALICVVTFLWIHRQDKTTIATTSKALNETVTTTLSPSSTPTEATSRPTPRPTTSSPTNVPTTLIPSTTEPTTHTTAEPTTGAPTTSSPTTPRPTTVAPTKAPQPLTPRQELAAQQIENYRKGNGLILNLHITHHGGTAFCGEVGAKLRHPHFACMGITDKDEGVPEEAREYIRYPWPHDETSKRIEYLAQYFDVISWEFAHAPGPVTLEENDWEDPNLVSIIIMREPISRLLAGDGYTVKKYPKVASGEGSFQDWWDYAHDDKNTDNFALRVLAGNNCCNGNYTDPIHLENAKALVERFTYVLDIECLVPSMQAVVDQLGLNLTLTDKTTIRAKQHQHDATPKDRIGYDQVYDYLVEKNKLDIELYQWSKTLALVNCSELA